jgi:hypothetical protein
MEKIVWEIPLKTVSEANCSEHWTISSKRHRQQQFFVRALFHGLDRDVSIPCKITLTRLNSRGLDDDNLVSAFKFLRDEVSECIFPEKRMHYIKNGKARAIKGRADSDPRIKWEYAQEKSKKMGVRIEIESLPQEAEISNKDSLV